MKLRVLHKKSTPSRYTDTLILEAIMKGGAELEQVMNFLYYEHSCREQVFHFVQSRQGSKEDAEDIFQDGIRNLIIAVKGGQYKGKGQLTAYLFGICKNLWFKRFKKMNREGELSEEWQATAIAEEQPDILLMEKEQVDQLRSLLAQIDEKCRKVLEMWKLSFSMKEISEELGYKSEGVARKKKRLCLQKVLKILDEDPKWEKWLRP